MAYGWDLETLSFVATATTQELSFLARSVDAVEPVYLGLDGVSLRETLVPEPSSGLLLGTGIIGLCMRRRRPAGEMKPPIAADVPEDAGSEEVLAI